MKKKILYFTLGISLLTACSASTDRHDKSIPFNQTVETCDRKVHRTMAEMVGVTDSMPRNVYPGQTRWNKRPNVPEEWCSGFWDGCLWYDYALTGKQDVLQAATETGERMLYLAHAPLFDHDLGFLTITSLLNGYRFSPDSTERNICRNALLAAADSLALLFNPRVGTLLSWPRNIDMFGGHNTIMDNMLNLELLFWAADETGREDLRTIAVSHADTTMAYHFREDGTCYHVAVYDPLTGKHLYNCTHQGLNDSSVWARGQAWAIYGYTMVYRYTHEPRHLAMAEKATDAYLCLLHAQKNCDYVPYWDFCDPRGDAAPRDASAAAVVASALYELQQYVDSAKAIEYTEQADRMMASLSADYMASEDCPAILLHSTGHHPAGSEIDAAIIYADYYFLEALYRLSHTLGSSTE